MIEKYIKNIKGWKGVLKIQDGWGLNKTEILSFVSRFNTIKDFTPQLTHTNLGKAWKYNNPGNIVNDGSGSYFFVEEKDYRYEFTIDGSNIDEIENFIKTIEEKQNTQDIVVTLSSILPCEKDTLPMQLVLKLNDNKEVQKFLYQGEWVSEYNNKKVLCIEK